MFLNRPHTLEDRAIEYAHSKRKALLDELASHLTQQAAVVAATGVRVLMHTPRQDVIFRQLRSGQNGLPFLIYKLHTLDEATGEPIFTGAQAFRALGLDETMQFVNIRMGQMGLRGWRPFMLSEAEELNDLLGPDLRPKMEIVQTHERPGNFSTNSIFEHWASVVGADIGDFRECPERVVNNNYEDFMRGSVRYDISLAQRVGELIITRLYTP
jgi:Bacterial sugar transferase